jgi:hypothetical protein
VSTSILNKENSLILKSNRKERKIQIEKSNDAKESQKEIEKTFGGAEAEYEMKKQALQNILNKGLLKNNLLFEYFVRVKKIIIPYIEKEKEWNSFYPFTYIPGTEDSDEQEDNDVEEENNLETRLFLTSVDCLCKFMILIPKVCEENLDIFFTLMEASSTPKSIKNNLLVTMGDLIRRHSTIMTEKKKLIFRNLRLKNPELRRTSVIVLCQLVLNDYLKLRGEVIDFVLLLNDSNRQIRKTLNTFFQELKKKDPKIFSNMIPDAINRFSTFQVHSQSEQVVENENKIQEESDDNQENLSQNTKTKFEKIYEQERLHDVFTKFLKFIIDFIDKDKTGPVLVEKLCNKLKFNKNKLEILNIFKCFYFFVSNDNAVLKILENSSVIKEKLEHIEVHEMMISLINVKLKKSNKVAKTTLDDFEKLVQSKDIGNEDSKTTKARQSKTKSKSKFKSKKSKSKMIIEE